MTRAKADWEREFELSGGVLCLDFANTVLKRNQPGRAKDELENYGRLVGFAKQTKLFSPAKADRLRKRASVSSRAVRQVLPAAIKLREAIYRVFSALAAGKPVASKDVKLVEDFALEAGKHRRLMPESHGDYRWQWKPEETESPGQMLWPIALSAAELLTSDRLRAVRECAADDCAWLFLDESRNHSRRWCDMTVCGNRQKARRHYHLIQR
ncbi:MAG TPA: ABATE domain-containing protein [Candidatus Limnocylindrales bacterium]|jgi:predicted RNA-binding Zn ribbon-like protein|nr:ABATE domain-containing protein [Candidatus Limnocylindrales bacterium]